jgi:hypothetical protein
MIAGTDFGDNMYNAVNGNPDAMSNLTLLAGSDMPINFTSSALTVVDVLEQAGVTISVTSLPIIYIRSYPSRM